MLSNPDIQWPALCARTDITPLSGWLAGCLTGRLRSDSRCIQIAATAALFARSSSLVFNKLTS
ncbi:hypothetical protein BC831DRAFT_474502 [Entophlyctis helioformis]|nr:hypothetical protein BC831DRAFT_474502 [Entophlyctis helioformis]